MHRSAAAAGSHARRGSGRQTKVLCTLGVTGALALAGIMAIPALATTAPPGTICADVHVIAARASTEAPGAGIIGSLVSRVQSTSRQTVSTDAVDYPALLNPYAPSAAEGTRALAGQLTRQVTTCPDQKIVLVGYSQGAHVVGDVLGGGGGGTLGAKTPPVDAAVSARVAAVIQMGDPRFIAGKPFDVGSARTDGLFPRGADQSLDAFADRIQSYCDTGDPFCARGASVAVHLNYTNEFNAQAARFVLDRIGG